MEALSKKEMEDRIKDIIDSGKICLAENLAISQDIKIDYYKELSIRAGIRYKRGEKVGIYVSSDSGFLTVMGFDSCREALIYVLSKQ